MELVPRSKGQWDEKFQGERGQTERGEGGTICSNLVSQSCREMQTDTATRPEDIIETEMLKELAIETIFETTDWFQRRFRGKCDSPSSWRIVKLVFLRKPVRRQ